MPNHLGVVLAHFVLGVLVSLFGAWIVRNPEISYAIRTSWKHDDVSLSDRGRTDQWLMGAVIFLIGLGTLLRGALLY